MRRRQIAQIGRAPAMFGFGPMFGMGGRGTFEATYRCYPVSFIEKFTAETADKVFLPPSALDRLGTFDAGLS